MPSLRRRVAAAIARGTALRDHGCARPRRVPRPRRDIYIEEKEARAAEGKAEELTRDSESRKQLLARAASLLERMKATKEQAAHTACIKIPKTVAQFRKDRNTAWKQLYKREAEALEGEMHAKRAKGRTKRSADPYARTRKAKQARKSTAYLAAAAAANAAETAASAALKRAREAAGMEADESGDDEASPQPAPAAHPAKKKR